MHLIKFKAITFTRDGSTRQEYLMATPFYNLISQLETVSSLYLKQIMCMQWHSVSMLHVPHQISCIQLSKFTIIIIIFLPPPSQKEFALQTIVSTLLLWCLHKLKPCGTTATYSIEEMQLNGGD